MQNETINLKQHLAAIKKYWQPEIINRHGFQFRLVKLLGDYGWSNFWAITAGTRTDTATKCCLPWRATWRWTSPTAAA